MQLFSVYNTVMKTHDLELLLTDVVHSLGASDAVVNLEIPENLAFGDFTTPVAMKLAKQLRKSPMMIATALKTELESKMASVQQDHNSHSKDQNTSTREALLRAIDRVVVVNPGYINIFLTEAEISTHISRVLETEKYDSTVQDKKLEAEKKPEKQERVMVEFTDPNPLKEFHIGHLYSNSVGESLCRLLESQGIIVRRVCYQGDVGLHVAKSIWGMIVSLYEKSHNGAILQSISQLDYAALQQIEAQLSILSQDDLASRVSWLGKCYAQGTSDYEKDASIKQEINRINTLCFIAAQAYHYKNSHKEIVVSYEKFTPDDEVLSKAQQALVQPCINVLYETGRAWSLVYFDTIYERLGTKFEAYYFESKVGEDGLRLVQEHIGTVFETSDGAVIYRGEKEGLHTRVFVNALGLPTYEAKELGLAPAKYNDWPYDRSIIVTGKEINEYFKVLLSAMKKIKPELSDRTIHIGHGMVRLPEGKMSSRTGNVKTGEWLIQISKDAIYDILDKNKSNYTEQERNDIAETCAIASVKYSLLKSALPGDITFDVEKSVSFSGDSGPYLLYTFARCRSIYRKAIELYGNDSIDTMTTCLKDSSFGAACGDEEKLLFRTVRSFPDIVRMATEHLAPHMICEYLYPLAQKLNAYYATTPVLPKDGENWQKKHQTRLALVVAISQTIQSGLTLLGIRTVERM